LLKQKSDMSKNIYEDFTNEKLLKRRDLFKGISIGFGLIFIILIAVAIYILTGKDFKKSSIATLIPIFTLPVTFVPVLINLSLLNKEIKVRNL
jgi:uncharacterized BrkB/YihY/UPF0761 family membrane protein